MSVQIQEAPGSLTSEELFPYEETDESGGEYFAHVINPTMNPRCNLSPQTTGQDVVDFARMCGIEITALCGYVFIPKRNPAKYPACRACIDIAHQIIGGE